VMASRRQSRRHDECVLAANDGRFSVRLTTIECTVYSALIVTT